MFGCGWSCTSYFFPFPDKSVATGLPTQVPSFVFVSRLPRHRRDDATRRDRVHRVRRRLLDHASRDRITFFDLRRRVPRSEQLRTSVIRQHRHFLHASLAPAAQNTIPCSRARSAHSVRTVLGMLSHGLPMASSTRPACRHMCSLATRCAVHMLGRSILACLLLTLFFHRFLQAQVPKKRTENEPALLALCLVSWY